MLARQITGISKAKAVAQFVRLMVEAGESVLLLGWHRAVYDIWLRELEDLRPAMYTGSEGASKKCGELERFLRGETDVMIMSLRSGAGVDGLQHRCSVAVFGQQNPVTAFFLVVDEGSDPPVMDVLGIKASEAAQIVDPHLGVQQNDDDGSNLQKLVRRYLEKGKGRMPPLGAAEALPAMSDSHLSIGSLPVAGDYQQQPGPPP